jgi:TP53 regulating kinase and related kinases
VDLYVLERALVSTHPNTEQIFSVILNSYKKACPQIAKEVIKKFEEIRLRGRKRLMIG